MDADVPVVSRSRYHDRVGEKNLADSLSTFEILWRRWSALQYVEIALVCMELRELRLLEWQKHKMKRNQSKKLTINVCLVFRRIFKGCRLVHQMTNLTLDTPTLA